ncbi:MAG TPA: serine hydrolase domain-containing protein [Candidatus Polarisedimenticolaceae bacterium]|nr:serine hydrolase domain-containing protein [Candidatus Polarisedimenticolaceae bacterium]
MTRQVLLTTVRGALAAISLTMACAPADDPPVAETMPPADIVADGPLAARIDAYAAPLAARGEFSGVVLVGSRDAILFARAYGMSDYTSDAPNRLETGFRVASITKTFTSAAVLRLRDEGKLELDDRLSRFAPDFPRGDEITIRHLLLHRSGLRNPDYLEAFERSIGLDELVDRIAARGLAFDPGTDGAYSNAGYNVLAHVVERASGTTYEDYLRQTILAPLGMETTDHDGSPARGYLPAPPPVIRVVPPEADPVGFMIGSGSLVSTAPDLWRWARAVADERIVGWKDLEWPYGWGRVEIGEHEGIEQTGATTGFMSSLLVFPDGDRFVVVLHNVEYGPWTSFGKDIAAIAFGEERAPPPAREPYALDPGSLEQYAGRYSEADTTLTVRAEEGQLRMYYNDWPIGKYLVPTSASRFAPLGDGGEIVFAGERDGVFSELSWRFGDSGTTYRRGDR